MVRFAAADDDERIEMLVSDIQKVRDHSCVLREHGVCVSTVQLPGSRCTHTRRARRRAVRTTPYRISQRPFAF